MKKTGYLVKIGFNTLVQSAGKILSVVLSFISITFLTRYLGPAGYGNYTLVFAYLALFSVISDFGLQLFVVRELSQGKNTKELYGTYFYIKLFLVILGAILSLLGLLFVPYSSSLKIAIIIGSLAVAVSNFSTFGNAIFQAKLEISKITIIDNVTKIVTVGLIVIFILLGANFYAIITTVLIGNIVGLFLTAIFLRGSFIHLFSFNKKKAKELIIKSIPIGLTTFFSFIYFKVDTLMLSLMKDATQVGFYSLAYKCLENVLIFWGFYMATTYPLLAKFTGNNKKQFKKLTTNSVIIAIISSLCFLIIGETFTPFVIYIFGGKGFSESTMSLQILLFTLPFLFLNNIWYNILLVYKKITAIIIIMGSTLCFNVILNIIYIPQYGYIGASYTTVASEVILLVLYIIFLRWKKAPLTTQ